MNIKSVLLAMACLSVFSFAALPEIKITTKDNQNPDGGSGGGGWGGMGGTHNYFNVTSFQLTDPSNSRNNVTRSSKPDSIKVRGNSTANTNKKPYKIKFGEKTSLFGKEAAKSWVLLANFYDATFSLNAMAFEMGKRMELEFTNSSQLVDLYINGTYKGIYQLTEQVQSNPGRVDIKEKHGGWLVEFDYHDPDSEEKPTWFKSDKYNLTTFVKAPELDDTSFTKNPPQPGSNFTSLFNFVKDDINALVNKMSENGFPNNGYRDMIDLESFAKYVLIQLVLDNGDFNSKFQSGYVPGSNYAYKIEDCGKIKGGPLWDFDLAAGVTTNGFPKHYSTYQDPITPNQPFYKRLWEDPVFKAKYKKAWTQYKSDFQAMDRLVDDIKSQVEGSITGKGNNIWAGSNASMMSSGTTLTTSDFNTQVTNLKSWLTSRINWVDQQLNSIDASQDIAETSDACKTSNSSSSKASSSSVTQSSSSLASSSSRPSSSSTVSSSSGNITTCADYQASWCGDNTYTSNTTTKPTLGQCVFVKDYTSLQVSSGGGIILINGEKCEGAYKNCVTNKPDKKDGGYYIYIQQGGITSSQNYTVTSGAPDCGTTPILTPGLTLSNLPKGANVEVYNLQGKLVYSGYSENLQIPIKTKGMYIIKIRNGNSAPTYQNRIYLN